MNNVIKESGLSGVAILLLGGVLPLLQQNELRGAIVALLGGLAILVLKYFLRHRQ
jgi:hypothetical protein